MIGALFLLFLVCLSLFVATVLACAIFKGIKVWLQSWRSDPLIRVLMDD